MMNIENDLIKAGYKKSVSKHYESLKMTDTLYQKRIQDNAGKKYFVDAWLFPERAFPNGTSIPEGVMFEAQFWTSNREDCTDESNEAVDVSLHTNDIDIAEREFEEIWKRMEYGYYENWDE